MFAVEKLPCTAGYLYDEFFSFHEYFAVDMVYQRCKTRVKRAVVLNIHSLAPTYEASELLIYKHGPPKYHYSSFGLLQSVQPAHLDNYIISIHAEAYDFTPVHTVSKWRRVLGRLISIDNQFAS